MFMADYFGLFCVIYVSQDSYVIRYFDSMAEYLSVGPPVYFVVEEGHNYTSVDGQNQLCGGNGCPEYSMLGQIFKRSQRPNKSV